MKIKRYNIEQLKKYSVVLSPAEQLMLLGGNRYEEGKYGVIVFDDDNNLIKIISYNDLFINGFSSYSELAEYTNFDNITPCITQCTLASGVTCFILQNSDILKQQEAFTKGFTDEMILGLERYKVDLLCFNEDNPVCYKGKEQGSSHYNQAQNMIALEANSKSLEVRVHEVVHSFQNNELHSLNHDDSVNMEYQAHVVAALYAIGKREINPNPTSTYGWLKNYIVPGDGGNFSVRSTIYDELNKHADTWFNDPSTPASYYNSKKVDGEFPNWKSDYDYKWSTLFNALGINVK